MTEVPAWARFRSFRKHGAIAQQPFYTTFHVAHKSTNKGTHETEKRVARMSLREPRLLCKYGCSLARAPISIRNVAAVTRRSSPIFVSTALILFSIRFYHRVFFLFFYYSSLSSPRYDITMQFYFFEKFRIFSRFFDVSILVIFYSFYSLRENK